MQMSECLSQLSTIALLFQRVEHSEHDTNVYVALDLECYEFDHGRVIEIGLAWTNDARLGSVIGHGITGQANLPISSAHYAVRENLYLRNEKFVPDRKDQFLFGKTKIIESNDAAHEFDCVLSGL